MIVALIHWRVKPDTKSKNAFIKHWKTNNFIPDRTGLIAEFLSDSMKIADFPWITWHLDPESLGNFKSYVTVGLWQDSIHFKDQVANYFNDDKPMLPFRIRAETSSKQNDRWVHLYPGPPRLAGPRK